MREINNILTRNPVVLDLENAMANLRRQGGAGRVFLYEHGFEPGIKEEICRRFDLKRGLDQTLPQYNLERDIRLYRFLGQEFLRVFPPGIVWPGLPASTTAAPPSQGPISNWLDFEDYAWPSLKDVDFSGVEWLEKNLPENMALWSMTYLFQQVSNLLGFAPMCLFLYEDRDLVLAVTEKVGRFYLEFTEAFCQFSRVGAINIGDDMGHKSGTLIDPRDLRKIFLPWQRRIITAAQNRGKLGFFHTCGQVAAIMDDLIDYVGIEARHSTQDVVETIQQSKQRWGARVALLGGVDIDFVTRAQPPRVAAYTRAILESCTPGGGFALGLGNWVADSIPVDNYLTVLATARLFGKGWS